MRLLFSTGGFQLPKLDFLYVTPIYLLFQISMYQDTIFATKVAFVSSVCQSAQNTNFRAFKMICESASFCNIFRYLCCILDSPLTCQRYISYVHPTFLASVLNTHEFWTKFYGGGDAETAFHVLPIFSKIKTL